ncbi:MAG: hypothetical protein IIC24_12930 [Chloroflexi bacterium]|nr:hypothetical protein [Chloroflexota bacterium]
MRATVIAVHRGENRNPIGLIVLTADFQEHDDVWVGTVLELGVSTFADNLDDVRSELKDATLLQLNEVERLGIIDEYIREQGVVILDLANAGAGPLSADKWELAPTGAGA